jgi:hypothetical protein
MLINIKGFAEATGDADGGRGPRSSAFSAATLAPPRLGDRRDVRFSVSE